VVAATVALGPAELLEEVEWPGVAATVASGPAELLEEAERPGVEATVASGPAELLEEAEWPGVAAMVASGPAKLLEEAESQRVGGKMGRGKKVGGWGEEGPDGPAGRWVGIEAGGLAGGSEKGCVNARGGEISSGGRS